ncbi:MAG: hypothetical protein H7138_00895 [Myxococcales bacterium]|nr:hypothetical protein [Myxococcales bacterium]
MLGAGLLGLATLSLVGCAAESPQLGAAEQAAINPPIPADLNLILNARTSVTIGAFTQVSGDVASSGVNGSVLFDVSARQGFFSGDNLLANTVNVRVGASVGRIFGNDITVEGSREAISLGLDPSTLPQVPAVTAAAPGTAAVSVAANQAKQLCAGQYGAISLGANATLNLNGGVYQLTRLTLAEGARLEPSEPVILLISGNMTTGTGAIVQAAAGALNPMTSADIRIEVAGAVTVGDSNRLRAHLLVPNGKFTTGKNTTMAGAAWAKTIQIGTQNNLSTSGVFTAQALSLPPPCNDNNACTADQCVSAGTIAFCRNTTVPAGTSCADDNTCNGTELCTAAGQCAAGTPLTAGTSCADGDVCNGDEACNGRGTCVDGTPLVVNDRNTCTADSCDPVDGVANDSVPDGTSCSGIGVCEAGSCSVEGAIFSEDFPGFQEAPAQCDRWNDFLINEVVADSYSSVSMNGTFNLLGFTCSDPAAATAVCRAMHDGSFASVFCDGHQWNVGQCGGVEVSVDSGICSCSFPGNSVRPCTSFGDWGGINTSTCGAPSQNLTVICQ